MPHGLGHFIGIDTHDVGGYLDGHPARSDKPGLKSLRTSRVVQERMCLTIEPGCYFIRALLDKAFEDERLSKFLVKDEIQKYINIGGVSDILSFVCRSLWLVFAFSIHLHSLTLSDLPLFAHSSLTKTALSKTGSHRRRRLRDRHGH